MKSKATYTLTLRPEHTDASDPEGVRRLRAALKCLLRSFGLRCVELRTGGMAEGENQNPADTAKGRTMTKGDTPGS